MGVGGDEWGWEHGLVEPVKKRNFIIQFMKKITTKM